jgi:hypothetical protein
MTESAHRNHPCSPTPLTSKLDKKIAAYMAAAASAGVSLLAAQPAQAKIIYTPANTVITATDIDLNHDGIPDFLFAFHELDHAVVLTVDPQAAGNAILRGGSVGGAAAGIFGMPVGPGEKFIRSNGYGWGVMMADAGSYSQTWFFGAWANATNRYLGLRFVINGQTHYGWARLTVPFYIHGAQVLLTGYAYETTPDTPILDGNITGPEKALNFVPAEMLPPSTQPLTLGMLARGVDALAMWRRDEDSATN